MANQIVLSKVAAMFSARAEPEPPKSRATVRHERARRFTETLTQRLTRNVLGLAYACHPKRIGELPALVSFVARAWIVGPTGLPDPDRKSVV